MSSVKKGMAGQVVGMCAAGRGGSGGSRKSSREFAKYAD